MKERFGVNMAVRKQERKKSYKGNILVVYIVVLLLFGVVMVGSRSLHAKDEEYRQREAALQTEIDEQLAIQAGLKKYDEYTHTKKYIEEVARTKLGLVYPDEIIFKAKE
ncbi:MAG: septum formation initiator family protein [Lachnospiraceae bacterium]|nr:septum formation initiator family protein [Lachnospiraceae bacterium]